MMIRHATPADIPAITAIYRHYVLNDTATFEEESPTDAEMRARFDKIVAAGLPYVVAEDDGRIEGYAYLNYFRTRSAYRFTLEDSIYLDPAATGKGLGSALLQRLLDDGERWGARQIVAVIGGNNPASVALHRRFGFEDVGVMKSVGLKFGQWLDTPILQKQLGDGSIPD
ncbi:MAG: GNAT family N-acetyltransferase [Rhodocyclaceae bacterium]